MAMETSHWKPALEIANATRTEMADIKKKIGDTSKQNPVAGKQLAAEVIRTSGLPMLVRDVLCSLHKIGPNKARRIAERAGVERDAPLGATSRHNLRIYQNVALTAAQRERLAAEVEAL